MQKLSITLLVCFLSIQMLQAQDTIRQTKTDAHQLIVGSNMWVIPPSGFEPAVNFMGFQQPDDPPTSMIVLMDLPGPYDKITEGFDSTMMAQKGMTLHTKEAVNLYGYNGLLLDLEQAANGMEFEKYILVYGDEHNTHILNVVCLKSDTLMKALKASVRSVYLDEAMEVDPLDGLDFSIDATDTKFKFGQVVANGILYTVDGNIPTQSEDETLFGVQKSIAQVAISDKQAFCKKRLTLLPYGGTQLDQTHGVQAIEIDGISGYALFAKGMDEQGEFKEHIYMAILFEANSYYILMGTFTEDLPSNRAELEQIARTFKRK